MKPLLYLASPLFNDSERYFNLDLTEKLEPYFNIYLPQRDGKLLINLINKGIDLVEAKRLVFSNDIVALLKSDYLLINLNGRTIDEGAVFELGFAFANKKICVGLQTDIRRLLPYGNNPMIDESLNQVFESEIELLEWAETEYAKSIEIFSVSI